VQLYLLKEFQRRGLGTQLVKRLFVEARELNIPIRLRVLAVNPAKGLYERLGFVVVERTPERYFLEWLP
jgi:GNAT superfamily N-acetyltransferase